MSYHGVTGSNVCYIGAPVRRREDTDLLAGRAATVADIALDGTLDLAFARSPIARARVRRVDVAAARALPGVAGAWTLADLADPPPTVTPFTDPRVFEGRDWFALAGDWVRFAGEPLAVVAAAARARAEDGAELVRADLEPLEPLLDPRQAAAQDAPRLFDGLPNVVSDRTFGEPVDDVLAAAPATSWYRRPAWAPTRTSGTASRRPPAR